MQRDNKADDAYTKRKLGEMGRGFFPDLVRDILGQLIVAVVVFVFATGVSAAVCLYYGLPLVLSLIGGFLAIGAVFFIKSISMFD
jgi:hypothetical protein